MKIRTDFVDTGHRPDFPKSKLENFTNIESKVKFNKEYGNIKTNNESFKIKVIK